MIKKCLGCGISLQNTDEDALGYTPNLDNVYCKRCFRLKNYGEETLDYVKEEEIFKRVNKSWGVVFFLIDFLNINQYTISLYQKIRLPKILVVSKCDILRKEMKTDKIKKWLKEVYKVDDALFISNKSSFKSSNIFKYLDSKNEFRAYILGVTNAGKSTFINNLLKKEGIKKEILASKKPNTTLDFIKLKIQDYIIYDTPGLSYQNSNLPLINKEIRPITYQVKGGTTLNVLNYQFSFLTDNSITFYGNVEISREYNKKDDELKGLRVPANYDIIIPGIGYINVKKESVILVNEEKLEVRLDMSGVDYE